MRYLSTIILILVVTACTNDYKQVLSTQNPNESVVPSNFASAPNNDAQPSSSTLNQNENDTPSSTAPAATVDTEPSEQDGLAGEEADSISLSDIPESLVSTNEVKDYNKLGRELVEETLQEMFGGTEPEDFINKFGTPVKEEEDEAGGYVRWYFDQGIEIDVVDVNDSYLMLYNYVYLSPECDLKTSREIGIGSTRDEVINKYVNEINPDLTDEEYIFAGAELQGISFVIKNDKVESIFIGTGAFTIPGP